MTLTEADLKILAIVIGFPSIGITALVSWSFKKREMRRTDLRDRLNLIAGDIKKLAEKGCSYWCLDVGDPSAKGLGRELKSTEMQIGKAIESLYRYHCKDSNYVDVHRRTFRQSMTDGDFESNNRKYSEARIERIVNASSFLADYIRRDFGVM